MDVALDKRAESSSHGPCYSREKLLEIFQQLREKEQAIPTGKRPSSSWLRTFKRLQEAKSKSHILSNIVLDEPIGHVMPVQKKVTDESRLPTISIPVDHHHVQPVSSFVHIVPRQKLDNNHDSTMKLENTTQTSCFVAGRHTSRLDLSKPNFSISPIPNQEMDASLGQIQFEPNPSSGPSLPVPPRSLEPLFRQHDQSTMIPNTRVYPIPENPMSNTSTNTTSTTTRSSLYGPGNREFQHDIRFFSFGDRVSAMPIQTQEDHSFFTPSGYGRNTVGERISVRGKL
jgi:hypothetical protein